MWEQWYALPLSTRQTLIRKYGSEFAAAWALFGGI